MEIDFGIKIIPILTFGLAFASVLGYLSHRFKFSPILGYLFAGYLIGPYSPGYVADIHIAEQLAEIGVILMMFGVGLHFKIDDLKSVKNVAIPGGLIQSFISASAVVILLMSVGWTLVSGMVIGLAISVASTVVLVRMMMDYKLVETTPGHIAVGWTIVEDMITVFILLLLPSLAALAEGGNFSPTAISLSILFALFKFVLLALLLFTLGHTIISNALARVVKTHSQELFTVTILALTFVIAVGSSYIFGTSIALGAFIAGMVMGQTNVSKRVANNAMPLKDAFVVMFFVSVGMLFNPVAINENLFLFFGVLAVIILLKPLASFLIVYLFNYPLKSALITAVALSQIGEFSFIVIEEALKFNLVPDEAYDMIVACSLVSIAINPFLFRWLNNKYDKQLA